MSAGPRAGSGSWKVLSGRGRCGFAEIPGEGVRGGNRCAEAAFGGRYRPAGAGDRVEVTWVDGELANQSFFKPF